MNEIGLNGMGQGEATNYVSLHPGEARDLAELLGVVEDWLLHAGEDTLEEFGLFAFRDSYHRPMAVEWFIQNLGSYACVLLRRAAAEQPSW